MALIKISNLEYIFLKQRTKGTLEHFLYKIQTQTSHSIQSIKKQYYE